MAEEIKQQIPAAGEPQAEVEQQQTSGDQPAPEFFLDEEGALQGDFSDWAGRTEEAEKEEQKTEAENEQKQPEQEQPNYYTPEELAKLELSQIDPTRLPPEIRPYYEAILKEANAEQMQSEQPDEKTLYDQIQQLARQRVEQLLGEQFDELNPKHIAALAVEANRIAQQLERQMAIRQKIAELAQSEPYFQQIDRYAQEKIQELPYREAIKIQQALQEGDLDTVLNFWEQCRREFYEKKLGMTQQTQQPQQPKQKPPAVEGAGKGSTEPPKQFNPREFANLTEDEQAQMLIKLGLV